MTPLERASEAVQPGYPRPGIDKDVARRILAAALSDEDEMVRVVNEAIVANYAQPRGLAPDIAAALRAYLLDGES